MSIRNKYVIKLLLLERNYIKYEKRNRYSFMKLLYSILIQHERIVELGLECETFSINR